METTADRAGWVGIESNFKGGGRMIRVIAKINKTKDEKSLQLIKEVVKAMVSHIPVKVGEYWIYGEIPVEFEVKEK